MKKDKAGLFVKQDDASFKIQYLEVDKRRLVEALQLLIHAADTLDGKPQYQACLASAKETLAQHQYCFMCHADKPKDKGWVKASHGGRVFCSVNCITNYAAGADLV